MAGLSKIMPRAAIGQGYGTRFGCTTLKRIAHFPVTVGMTESSTTISMWPEHQHIAVVGSAGHLIPGMTARVLKKDGSFGKEGEQGELIVKGPAIALGYLDNDAAYVHHVSGASR
jgi:4-coumarate--CoA ligase